MTVEIEQGLGSYLSAYAGLVALVSTRVYHMRIPERATFPLVIFQRISTPRQLTHDTSGATGTLESPRFQFDAYGTTALAVKAITTQLRAALHGKTGTIGSGANEMTIQAAYVMDEVPEYDVTTELYRQRSDFMIWHIE